MNGNEFQHPADGLNAEDKCRKTECMESYFHKLVENLPGGVAVITRGEDGVLRPAFFTDGFADMTGMTRDQVRDSYGQDAMSGVHPDDRDEIYRKVEEYIKNKQKNCELIYRMIRGDGSYFWVRNIFSQIKTDGDKYELCAVYQDITDERKRQELLREKYNELIRRHYQTPTAETLVLGHCNITARTIYEIFDYTGMGLMDIYGNDRDEFFTGLSALIADDEERSKFLNTFLSDKAMNAFKCGEDRISQECFILIPGEKRGRYAHFSMNMVETPGSNDITGILTVTDVTEKKMTEKILYSASVLNSDFVSNLDVFEDRYTVLSKRENVYCVPPDSGSHIQRMKYMIKNVVVPEDREFYSRELNPGYIHIPSEKRRHLQFCFFYL